MTTLSLAIPVYCSSPILPELMKAIEAERVKHQLQLEVVLVDDGSKDSSFETLCNLQPLYPYMTCIKLARNFGHQGALRTALEYCQGDVIGIIDDDLQDPPSLIPVFLKELEQGYDVIYGIRQKRKEGPIKVFLYKMFYQLLKLLSEVDIPLDSGDFCLMKRSVLLSILACEERNLFLRGIRSWVGGKQKGIEYERSERHSGESGYTFKKLFKLAFDGLLSFSNVPLRLMAFIGGTGLIFSAIYSIYILSKFFSIGVPIPGFTTLSLLIIFFGTLNLMCLGIIGEYLAKIYNEGKKRPFAIVSEVRPHHLKDFDHERNYSGRWNRNEALSTHQKLL